MDDGADCRAKLKLALAELSYSYVSCNPHYYEDAEDIVRHITSFSHDEILILLDGVFFRDFDGNDVATHLPERYYKRIIACGSVRHGYGSIENKRETIPELVAEIKQLLSEEDIREYYAL